MRKKSMRLSWHVRALLPAALFIVATSLGARAQDKPVVYRDVETKYVFGFTEGSGIGLEGEKEFSLETEARIGKRDGRYHASETKLEFEFTPNQYVQFEFGPFISAHQISGVTDLELEVKLNADLELIKNRLYLGANLLYEPEATRDSDHIGAGWAQESKGGVSAALAYRIVPSVFIGAEVWYLRHYDGAWFNTFTGDAVYVGPTLFVQLAPKVFMKAAWNTQVHGSEVDNPGASLNLSEFSRPRAKLK